MSARANPQVDEPGEQLTAEEALARLDKIILERTDLAQQDFDRKAGRNRGVLD